MSMYGRKIALVAALGALSLPSAARADYVSLGELLTCEGEDVNQPAGRIAIRAEVFHDEEANWYQIRNALKFPGQPVETAIVEQFGVSDGGLWLDSELGFLLTGGQRILIDGFVSIVLHGSRPDVRAYSVFCRRGMNWSDIVKPECRRSSTPGRGLPASQEKGRYRP
jgi:hypothetical protein